MRVGTLLSYRKSCYIEYPKFVIAFSATFASRIIWKVLKVKIERLYRNISLITSILSFVLIKNTLNLNFKTWKTTTKYAFVVNQMWFFFSNWRFAFSNNEDNEDNNTSNIDLYITIVAKRTMVKIQIFVNPFCLFLSSPI